MWMQSEMLALADVEIVFQVIRKHFLHVNVDVRNLLIVHYESMSAQNIQERMADLFIQYKQHVKRKPHKYNSILKTAQYVQSGM